MTSHDVVYIHDCPKPPRQFGVNADGETVEITSGRRVHVISYDSPSHEYENLRTQTEHICQWCKQPMTRLGVGADLRESGAGEGWLDPSFYGVGQP